MIPPAFVLTVRLIAGDEDTRRQLAALVGPTGAQPGCRRCLVLCEAAREEAVTLLQEWATRDDLDRHLRSAEFWRLLLIAELSDEPPEFTIDTVSCREGLDAVARSREGVLHAQSTK